LAQVQGINYQFIETNQKNFYGWQKVRIEGKLVKIAVLEKAILDKLHFKRTIYSIDLVLEKLKEYKGDFNWEQLNQYS
jgi:hypothetical protein